MDRGAWWAAVHGVARVGYNLATKPLTYLRDLEQNHDDVFYSKVTFNFVTSNDSLYSET